LSKKLHILVDYTEPMIEPITEQRLWFSAWRSIDVFCSRSYGHVSTDSTILTCRGLVACKLDGQEVVQLRCTTFWYAKMLCICCTTCCTTRPQTNPNECTLAIVIARKLGCCEKNNGKMC